MRVDRGRLIFLALAVLEQARGRLHQGAYAPGPDVRLALAVLFSFSRSADRRRYDKFWRNLSDPCPDAYSDVAAKNWRMSEAHRLFEGIARDVGAPADIKYRSKIGELVHGRPKHPWTPGIPVGADVGSACALSDGE